MKATSLRRTLNGRPLVFTNSASPGLLRSWTNKTSEAATNARRTSARRAGAFMRPFLPHNDACEVKPCPSERASPHVPGFHRLELRVPHGKGLLLLRGLSEGHAVRARLYRQGNGAFFVAVETIGHGYRGKGLHAPQVDFDPGRLFLVGVKEDVQPLVRAHAVRHVAPRIRTARAERTTGGKGAAV